MTGVPGSRSKKIEHYDVIVVGAGIGGVYAIQRFRRQGLSVLGIEGAGGVGGVWYHNRYPGARVDVDSLDYCYYFSEEAFGQFEWSERYAAQPELLRYINHVADACDVKRHFLFETWVTSATWQPGSCEWQIGTSTQRTFRSRFLVMATGNLSRAKDPDFPGLDRFRGEWVQTSHWPQHEVEIDGRRVGVVGTGSTGVQATTEIAKHADHLYVFQRTPHYVVPARNRPADPDEQKEIALRVKEEREVLLATGSGTRSRRGDKPASDYPPEEQLALMEYQWEFGGQAMNTVFSDQRNNLDANTLVAEFVRNKVRETVQDPAVAEKLVPSAYPIGTRRLALDSGYYETFNRDNVTLVDVRADPIIEIDETGIRTAETHYELDLIVFAIGFHAFTGALDQANIRNEKGAGLTEHWKRGPQTVLGMMTVGFPNLFIPTGPGGPSVLANLFLNNEFCIDWIADAIAYLDGHGAAAIEPSQEAQASWTAHVADVSRDLLRRNYDNYMVQVNDDGTRVFIPYFGGFSRFARAARKMAKEDYAGFSVRDSDGHEVRPTPPPIDLDGV